MKNLLEIAKRRMRFGLPVAPVLIAALIFAAGHLMPS